MENTILRIGHRTDATKSCVRCGAHFHRNKNDSKTQWAGRMFCGRRCGAMKRKASDHEIRSLYRGGLSTSEVAELTGITATHVGRIVSAYGEIRSASERQKISTSRPDVRAKMGLANRGKACPEHVKAILRKRTGSKNHNWRSGLTMSPGGYLSFTTSPSNGEHGGKLLHKVIAEWKIGRPLAEGEVVHHCDENKLNNAPSNLQVMTQSDHAKHHALKMQLGRKKKCQAA